MTGLPDPLAPADADLRGRIAISKKTRFEVFKRDGFCCQYCGAVPPAVLLEVDHIDPVCNGGTNDIDNLVTACFNCNRGKAGNLLTVIPTSLAEKAAEIQEREAQIHGYRVIIQARLDRIEDDMWHIAELLFPRSSTEGLPRDWLQSIKNFNAKLPRHEVEEAVEIARASPAWAKNAIFRYFCGVCWNKIREGPR